MDWFIRKGQTVEENKPQRLRYLQTFPVLEPSPHIVEVEICTCPDTDYLGPPKYKDARVQSLVLVSADLSRIPNRKLARNRGVDGSVHYVVAFAVEVSYFSGYSTYELVYDGQNFGAVAAEYV
ncbi:MAG: hypothetical protein L6R35_003917 [Caloplaca aegaea]|nr:MAG: hypothetical protein L6R35_003917 [Caloplaca aegaea]